MKRERPLFGRRILVTRARSQAGAFARAIEQFGGEVVEFPTIEILPPESFYALDEAIRGMTRYYWIIFTSVNGVRYFFDRFQKFKRSVRDLKGIRIAAIGPETARALESRGVAVNLVPREYQAEAILQRLDPREMNGRRVLLPRARGARDVLPKTLRAWGAEVDVIESYRTAPGKGDIASLRRSLRGEKVDMVTFTSSSTVANFVALLDGENPAELLAHTAVACIGPITRKTAEEKGIRVDVVPRDYTIPGLTQAIVEYFKMQNEK